MMKQTTIIKTFGSVFKGIGMLVHVTDRKSVKSAFRMKIKKSLSLVTEAWNKDQYAICKPQ